MDGTSEQKFIPADNSFLVFSLIQSSKEEPPNMHASTAWTVIDSFENECLVAIFHNVS
jgi:hypothetical protein